MWVWFYIITYCVSSPSFNPWELGRNPEESSYGPVAVIISRLSCLFQGERKANTLDPLTIGFLTCFALSSFAHFFLFLPPHRHWLLLDRKWDQNCWVGPTLGSKTGVRPTLPFYGQHSNQQTPSSRFRSSPFFA